MMAADRAATPIRKISMQSRFFFFLILSFGRGPTWQKETPQILRQREGTVNLSYQKHLHFYISSRGHRGLVTLTRLVEEVTLKITWKRSSPWSCGLRMVVQFSKKMVPGKGNQSPTTYSMTPLDAQCCSVISSIFLGLHAKSSFDRV